VKEATVASATGRWGEVRTAKLPNTWISPIMTGAGWFPNYRRPGCRGNFLSVNLVLQCMHRNPCVAVTLILFAALTVRADDTIKSQAELEKTVTALDAALFNAYNRCELEKFSAFFTDDVEFYHDQGGVTLGREKLTESLRNNICGKVTRELVPGSLRIYPMKGYGAVQIGVHRFHHPGRNDTEPVGEARFIHLWQYKDGGWKITRVISFDHHALPK
jgi:hypothetical protein